MNKEEIKQLLQNLKIENKYSWELYLFNIDNRVVGSPYQINKLNFTSQDDILKYGQNLVNCIEKYQLDTISEVECYCGENPKISCDKLNLENEVIKKYWDFFYDSLNSAVVDSSEGVRVKGYVMCAEPKIPGLKKFIFVKKANPIVKGEKKKSKTFRMNESETLDSFNDKIFKFYLNVDFFILDNNLYTFNLSFQEIFKIEKTLKKFKNNAIEHIIEKKYFDNKNDFFSKNIASNIPSQMFLNFDIKRLTGLDNLDNRNRVAENLNLDIDSSGNLKFGSIDDIKVLIKYLNNRIIKEEITEHIFEVSGNVKKR